MAGRRLVRLEIEPLIDAVFELRFNGHQNFIEIFPGILYQEISAEVKTERLAPSELPLGLRQQDPNLRYAGILALRFAEYGVMLSEHSIIVSAKMPYGGWQQFRDNIFQILAPAFGAGLITEIERFSLKYVNMLPVSDDENPNEKTKFKFEFGDLPSDGSLIDCRVERTDGNAISILRVISHAHARNALTNEHQSGVLLEIDTIRTVNEDEGARGFDFISANLDELKDLNRNNFLNMVAEDTLHSLGPTYDNTAD